MNQKNQHCEIFDFIAFKEKNLLININDDDDCDLYEHELDASDLYDIDNVLENIDNKY